MTVVEVTRQIVEVRLYTAVTDKINREIQFRCAKISIKKPAAFSLRAKILTYKSQTTPVCVHL